MLTSTKNYKLSWTIGQALIRYIKFLIQIHFINPFIHLLMLIPRVWAFDFSCNFFVKFPTMGKQICDQMPHCWAHIFVVKVVCPSPQHICSSSGCKMAVNSNMPTLGRWCRSNSRGGETKIDQMPHICQTSPWGLAFKGA